jgi:deoxyribodipyrimidine photo-lyase
MLSAHLKFGTLSVRELVAALVKPEAFGRVDNPLTRELVFRSFYIKICSSRPGLQRAESFRQDIDVHIPWKRHGDPEYARLWKAWTEGNTGFPLADAGMRQLNATGYMHGRVRMVAATVLTRYFLIDWRDGARYFAQHLVDYDPCSNNMGWQFSSALGENTQNVYRAPMNPFLQSKNYDADCVYIQRWIPELKEATPKQIHTGAWSDTLQYPKPIVDQKVASRRAVTTWKSAISHTHKD